MYTERLRLTKIAPLFTAALRTIDKNPTIYRGTATKKPIRLLWFYVQLITLAFTVEQQQNAHPFTMVPCTINNLSFAVEQQQNAYPFTMVLCTIDNFIHQHQNKILTYNFNFIRRQNKIFHRHTK